MKKYDRFIVCSSGRTGSTLLCSLLESTGAVTLFQTDLGHYEPLQNNRSPAPLLAALQSPREKPLGFKVHYGHLKELVQSKRADSRLTSVQEAFRFFSENAGIILVLRRDKVRQAVSFARAKETTEWLNTSGRAPKKKASSIKKEDIFRDITMLRREEANWKKILKADGRNYLEVYFEDLVSDREREVGRVLDFLSVPRDGLVRMTTALQKQSDEQKEALVREYIRLERNRVAYWLFCLYCSRHENPCYQIWQRARHCFKSLPGINFFFSPRMKKGGNAEGERPSATVDFDWEFYVREYPDLIKAGINTREKAWKHYLTHGKKEGRRINY